MMKDNIYDILKKEHDETRKKLDNQNYDMKRLVEENEEWTDKHNKAMNYWREKHEKTVMSLNDMWENKISECRKLFKAENDVLSHIVERQMIDVV